MAKQRQTTPQVPQVALSPAASPVSVLRNPSTPIPEETNSLLQLGKALEEFVPGAINGIQAYATQEKRAGEAAALGASPETLQALREENREKLREAVKRGDLPAGANPYFIKGMKLAAMRIKAQEYSQALTAAWEKSDTKNSDDPGALQSFTAAFSHEWIQAQGLETDQEFAQAFAPLAQQAQGNLAAHHAAYRVQQNEFQALQQIEQETNLLLESSFVAGVPVESVSPFLQGIMDDYVANGMDPRVANQAILKSIAMAAEQNQSLAMTYIPDSLKAGSGSLGNTSAAKELMERTRLKIAGDLNEFNGRTNKVLEDKRKQDIQNLENAYAQKALEDPLSPDLKALEKQMAALDGSKVGNLINLQATVVRSKNELDDQGDVEELLEMAWEQKLPAQEILKAAGTRQVSYETLMRVLDDARGNEKLEPVFKTSADASMQDLKNSIQGSDLNFDPQKASKAAQAVSDFRKIVFRQNRIYEKEGFPDPIEYMEWLDKVKNTLSTRYGGAASQSQGIDGGLPQAPGGETPQGSPQTSQVPAQPRPLFPSVEDLRTAVQEYQNLDDKQKATHRLTYQADALGITIEELVKQQAAAFKQRK